MLAFRALRSEQCIHPLWDSSLEMRSNELEFSEKEDGIRNEPYMFMAEYSDSYPVDRRIFCRSCTQNRLERQEPEQRLETILYEAAIRLENPSLEYNRTYSEFASSKACAMK